MNESDIPADTGSSAPRTGTGEAYGRMDVAIPQMVHEAGRLSTVSIIIRNPFNVPVDVLEIQGPRSSHLQDMVGSRGQSTDSAQEKSLLSSIGRHLSRFSISEVRIAGLTAEFPGRERKFNISAAENSQLTIDTALNEFDVVNVDAKKGAVVNFVKQPSQPPASERQIITIEPNCETVAYFHLRTAGWLFFTPTRQSLSTQIRYRVDGREKTQVATAEFEIKPPLSAIVIGSVIGALLGTMAKVFTTARQFDVQSLAIAIAASVVMALIASIALSRKAASQAFITVEDFFGGFVVGALIGYGGSGYFERAVIPDSATGLSAPAF